MTWADIVSTGRGTPVAGLFIEGLPYWFSSSQDVWKAGSYPAPFDTNRPTQIPGALEPEGLKYGQKCDIKGGDLQMPDLTFTLIDTQDPDGNQFALSALLTGLGAAVVTELREDLAASGEAAIDVESSSDFDSAGNLYINLETIAYTSKPSGTSFGGSITRGMYGSRAVHHGYDPDPGGQRPDGGLVPEVTNRPVSWYGRRVYLALASVDNNGEVSASTVKWIGVLRGELALTDGLAWTAPAESIWQAQDTEIMATAPTTALSGILLEGSVTCFLQVHEAGGGSDGADSEFFSIPAGLYGPEEILRTMEDLVNARLDIANADANFAGLFSGGFLEFEERFTFTTDGQHTNVTRNHQSTNAYDMWLVIERFVGENIRDQTAVAACFGAGEIIDGGHADFYYKRQLPRWTDDGLEMRLTETVESIVTFDFNGPTTVPVEDASQFEVIDDSGVDSDGREYLAKSVVSIGDAVYLLTDTDLGNGTITVEPFAQSALPDGAPEATVGYAGAAPVEVVAGVWVMGELWAYWREGFIENTNVPDEWKGGLRTEDFDWDDMHEQVDGGAHNGRDRVILKPTSFRAMFLEDLAWAGLVPAVSSEGLITCRRLVMPNDASVVMTLSADEHEMEEVHGHTFSPARTVNQVLWHMVREQTRPRDTDNAPFDITAIANDRSAQARYGGLVNKRQIDGTGLRGMTKAEVLSLVAGLSQQYFLLAARDYPVITIAETVYAAELQVMDAVYLTHWVTPNPDTPNERGVTGALCLVVGVEVEPLTGGVDIELIYITDNVRGGIAPALRIVGNQFTVEEGPPLTPPYAYLYETGHFSDAEHPESDHFSTAGLKVQIRHLGSFTPLVFDGGEVVSIDTDAGIVYLDLVPTVVMDDPDDWWVLVYDKYGTADQLDEVQVFIHIAAEATGLLDGTTDRGYKIG